MAMFIKHNPFVLPTCEIIDRIIMHESFGLSLSGGKCKHSYARRRIRGFVVNLPHISCLKFFNESFRDSVRIYGFGTKLMLGLAITPISLNFADGTTNTLRHPSSICHIPGSGVYDKIKRAYPLEIRMLGANSSIGINLLRLRFFGLGLFKI